MKRLKVNSARVEMLKKIYKNGDRVVCDFMDDPSPVPSGTVVVCDFMDDPSPVPSGTVGTVTCVDSIGQIHVNWDNGSTLALTEIDKFHKL